MENKFKVGDIIRGDSNEYNYTDYDMTRGRVTKVYNKKDIEVEILEHKTAKHKIGYKYDVESRYFKFAKPKKFTRADLRDGDILTLRNGEKGTYCDDMYIDGLRKQHINKDLTNNGLRGKFLDIVKVERVTDKELLFERDEEKEEILDEAEKKYLSQVIRPFRKKITCIELKRYNHEKIYMKIYLKNDDAMNLPNFKKGTMYKGMELDREYTLKELGL